MAFNAQKAKPSRDPSPAQLDCSITPKNWVIEPYQPLSQSPRADQVRFSTGREVYIVIILCPP